MRRVLSYFSRPYIFALTMLLLIGLAAVTWSFDQYLAPYIFENASISKNAGRTATARIVERKRLIIGVRNNVAPFGFETEDANLQGFDIDIAREFSRRWLGNLEGAEQASLELRVVNAADRIPLLVSHEIDLLIAAMPNRRDRDALIDFSRTYFEDSLGLLVRASDGIDEFVGLRERRVAVLTGSAAGNTLARESSRQEVALQVREYNDYPKHWTR